MYWGVGLVYRHTENYVLAAHNFRRALGIYGRLGESGRRYISGIRLLLGWVLIELGEYEEAATELISAKTEAEASAGADSLDVALVSINLAFLHYKRDKSESSLAVANQYIQRGIDLARQHNDQQTLGLALAQLAEIKLVQQYEPAEAKELFEQALACLHQTSSHEYIRQIYKRYARAMYSTGFTEEAFAALDKAYQYLIRQPRQATS